MDDGPAERRPRPGVAATDHAYLDLANLSKSFESNAILRSFSLTKNSPVKRKPLPTSSTATPTTPNYPDTSNSNSNSSRLAPVRANNRSFTSSSSGGAPSEFLIPRNLDLYVAPVP